MTTRDMSDYTVESGKPDLNPQRLKAALEATGDNALCNYVFDGVDEADIMRQANGDVAVAVDLCRQAMADEAAAR